MASEFEITAYMDGACTLNQLSQFITDIEKETGLDCRYEGNLSYTCEGEIRLYQCSLIDVVQVLKVIDSWKGRVSLYCVFDGTKEWRTSEGPDLAEVINGEPDGISDRILNAIKY